MKNKARAVDAPHKEHEPAESENRGPEPSGVNAEAIRQRAYELYVEGGCVHGRDVEDWLQAERELNGA